VTAALARTSPAPAGASRSLRSHRLLLATSVAAVVAEAATLQALGMTRSVGLAPQAAAPVPYGVFHDLRWLIVYHTSMTGFALEAAAWWLGRSAISAVLLRAAWGDPATRPRFGAAFGRSAAFTLVCAVLLTPFAALMFGAAIAGVSWLVLAAVPSVLAIAMLAGHGSVVRRWYACATPVRITGWMVVAFVGYTAAAAALTAAPGWLVVPLAVVCGLFDAWVWRGIVAVTERRRAAGPARARIRPGPPSVVWLAAFSVVLFAGTAIGFHAARITLHPAAPATVGSTGGRPVVVVSGFGTPWTGAPPDDLGAGFDQWRFSYAGMSPASRPLPYAGPQTYQPLPLLVRRLAAQVEAFRRVTGRDVTIVAESEGALVAETYLHATPDAPVDAVVVLSPLVEPGRVYYPPASGSGFGVATGWELRGLSATIHQLGSETIDGDSPFLRSVADRGPQLQQLLHCPVTGVGQLAVLPLADATSRPYASTLAVPSIVVPGFHGGLLGDHHVQRLVAAFLRSGVPPRSTALDVTDRAIAAGAAAWQVPDLEVSANPAWSRLSAGGCAAGDRALHDWVYGPAAPGS
jgi:hypothetical protein